MPDAQLLQKYAQVAIEVGVGLGPGDRLLITSPISAAPFTRLLASTAYEKGAVNVDVIWTDEDVTRSRFSDGPSEAAEAITGASYLLNNTLTTGDYLLSVRADDPNLLAGQDPERVANHQRVNSDFTRPAREAISTLTKNWSIVAAPTPVWARAVFPYLDDERAVEAMWDAVFRVCRVYQPDPVGAWEEHLAEIENRSAYLNGRRFDALRYRGPGSDLVLGLPDGHVWLGGQVKGPGGGFVPNIPTEEVFTAPDLRRAEGRIRATKPLSLFGTLVEELAFEMSEGMVVAATASTGQDMIDRILERDDSTKRFGEAALVPQSSNVAREGLIWQNTLYDENDACHIALGTAYPVCIEGGAAMSVEERRERGLNSSSVHIDFVVGSTELDIFGVDSEGVEEPILVAGEWAFEV
jgi:aminopeptidase